MNSTQVARLADRRKAIGTNIKVQRTAIRWTQRELGEALGYKAMAISRIERGVSPVSSEMLTLIAEKLCCPVDRLIGVSTGAS